mgnify:CR=1 FL=1
MTLSEYELLERDFLSSSTDIRTFLQSRGVSHHKYYYWKRRSRELKEPSSIAEGQFLPIDLHSGGLIKPSKRVKRARQPLIGQGEIEIEPQADAMFSLNDSMRYLLYSEPTDMRKSYHTLRGLVTNNIGLNIRNGDVFLKGNSSKSFRVA